MRWLHIISRMSYIMHSRNGNHPHIDVELEVLDRVGHQETVLETCLGKGRT